MRLLLLVSLGVATTLTSAVGQTAGPTAADLLRAPAVSAALDAVRRTEPQLIEEQIAICQVPAPPFKENKRAEVLKQKFQAVGLQNVRIDRVGNVIGDRPGTLARPRVVFSAHLDTVFPEDTDVNVTRQGTILKGPGIGDDCRGLAVLLGIVRALDAGKVETPGTLTFVADVGEEGLGDLRGVKHLFNEELKGQIDRFVSIDGVGSGLTNVAVGSHRYRVTFKGPGGHSYGAFGAANPIHALGRAIAKISEFQVPSHPKTTFNVGRIGGGTSVNSIAFESWMEVDMRSSDSAALQTLDANFQRAVDAALAEENARWQDRGRLTVEKELVGDRPAGRTSADSPIVKMTVAVTEALGLPVRLDEGSTDSNVPMNLGIPAITIDGGGSGSGAHSLGETFDTADSWKGTQRATLLAIALAQR